MIELVIIIILLLMLITREVMIMGTGLTNLQDAVAKLQAQQAATITFIQSLQSGTGDSDTAVQAAADAVNAVTTALAAASTTQPAAPAA
jgi:hypothetical protein